jgi:RimJ/RimL family protein N-acetyltransferase
VSAPEVVTTERLVLRRVTAADQPFWAEMFADARVNATLGGPRDDTQIAAIVESRLRHWREHGFGTWTVRDITTGEPLGWVGLEVTETGGPGSIELLYSVAADHWRRGIATEAGRAALAVAAEALELRELVCYTLVENVASQSTMRGLGFRGDERVEHWGLPHVLMRLELARQEVGDRG